MAKVRIVQVAVTDRDITLLDDQGRVWVQSTQMDELWKQLDLPDEPTNT